MPDNKSRSKIKREHIIKQASEVFARYGLHGARTRDIASKADINEALIYKYFDGKEDLFKQCIDYVHHTILKKLEPSPGEVKSGMDALHAGIRTQVEYMVSSPDSAINILQGYTCSIHDKDLQDWARDWKLKRNQHLRSILEMGIKDGSIRPDIDMDATILLIEGAGLALIMSQMFDLSDDDLTSLSERVFQAIFNNIKAG